MNDQLPIILAIAAPILIGAAISLAVSAALMGISYLLAPKPQSMPANYNEVGQQKIILPTYSEGTPIAYVFGTANIAGMFVWPRDASIENVNVPLSGVSKTGADYRLSWVQMLCWGPVNAIHRIAFNDTVVFDSVEGLGMPANGKRTNISLGDKYDASATLYYGNGIYGGNLAQPASALIPSEEAPPWCSLCFLDINGANVGSTPIVPKMVVLVRRDPVSPLADTHVAIKTGSYWSANPVHVLAELLTDTRFGIGLSTSDLDLDSFNAAALTCYNEGRGISGAIEEMGVATELLEKLLGYLDGALIRRNGKWALRLVRYDYAPDSVQVIGVNDLKDWESICTTPASLPQFFSVEYTGQTNNFKSTLVPMQCPSATLSLQTNKRETISLPWVIDQAVAVRVASTRMQVLAIQHEVIKCKLTRRAAFTLEWGDVVKVIYPKDGLDGTKLHRVVGIEKPFGDSYATVEMVEEIGFVAHPAPQPSGSSSISRHEFEGPLPELAGFELPRAMSPDRPRYSVLAGRKEMLYADFMLYGGPDAVNDLDYLLDRNGRFCVTGRLQSEYTANTFRRDDSGGLVIEGGVDMESFVTAGSLTEAQFQSLARVIVIGDEIMAFKTIASEGGGVYRVTGVLRGMYGSRIATHAADAQVFIFTNGLPPFNSDMPSNWPAGQNVYLKAIPYGDVGVSVPENFDSITWVPQGRWYRPPKPFALAVGGEGYRPTYYWLGSPVTITFWPCSIGSGFGYDSDVGIFGDGNPEGYFIVQVWPKDASTPTSVFSVSMSSRVPAGQPMAGKVLVNIPASVIDAMVPYNPEWFDVKIFSVVSNGGDWQSEEPLTVRIYRG